MERRIPTAEFVAPNRGGPDGDGAVRISSGAEGGRTGRGQGRDRRAQQQADEALGSLTGPLVIEEFLRGEEVSFIALCDGRQCFRWR